MLAEVEGRCLGRITQEPRGDDGFGYDPIFEATGTDLTFAEMPSDTKERLSHRGLAFMQLEPKLRELLKVV